MTLPGMSVAGRGITSYLSNASMNNMIKTKYEIKDNTEYKEYIRLNGASMADTLHKRSAAIVKREQWWSKTK
jgi:hypothetical protein